MAPPHGLKIMNLLGRLKILICSLGRQSVDCLDQICLKYGAPVTLCVFLAYIEDTVAREGHYICLGYKEELDFTICMRCMNLVQAHLGNTLMGHFSFSKDAHMLAVFFAN